MTDKYVIGVDYGTDSVRAVVVNTQTGEEIAVASKKYSCWKKGLYCDPSKNQYRQHPKDYIEGLRSSVKKVLDKCNAEVTENVV
ncbi:MAG: ribulokinase, partial [Flavobacteriaceae bacterium]|nr:ribulokinase [Flavobacteriaceae bacterium]